VDGVVAMVMDEDEVDAVLVVVVVFVAMTESKTQAVMKRFQVEVKGEVGVWGEVEVFELMDLYQHQPCQELFEVDSGVVTRGCRFCSTSPPTNVLQR
jgi:hypothetical protein